MWAERAVGLQIPSDEPEAQAAGEKEGRVNTRKASMHRVDESHITFALTVAVTVSEELVEICLTNAVVFGRSSGKHFPFRIENISI